MKKLGTMLLGLYLAGSTIYARDNIIINDINKDFEKKEILLKAGRSSRAQNPDIGSVIKSFNGLVMRSAIESSDNQKMGKENIKNAALVKKYLKEKCGIVTDEDGEDSPEATLIFGLFQYGKEKKLGDISDADLENLQGRAAGDPFSCLVGAIGGLIGLGEVRALYNDYMHGVTPRTILKTLKTIVRRVGSVFTIISSVYSFGDCLDWW